ncbi:MULTISPECIES: hypothetical protein [Streptomyces]|uniref:Uncharacterized protein n=1 Tax=Streptomyces chartreusis NRRL 3882 TaxID=1079985 RepID=A0A2N9AZN7_STRCX|nr:MULTISPECIES: hypothetical protein [Streptomyces]MYS94897.1 hypothetical protein [Streptomyces sp. SID5464]SOR76544.1 hypothetical protein SCNRRL3882_0028 [Streptomyces chartreusis NRRL 3882]SOR84482.1 hypothetical protein SCNRRL3882_7927 [Streptomyces chartreusis NRRL 3882]
MEPIQLGWPLALDHRRDTPSWSEPAGTSHPLLDGTGVGRCLTQAVNICGRPSDERPPCQQRTSSRPPIDATTIRQAYDTAMWYPPAEEADRMLLADQLLGHMEHLLPELAALVPRMQGAKQGIAQRVITTTTEMLKTNGVSLHELGTLCRALLTLVKHPGPLRDADRSATTGP